jgi:hypothetical protein
MASARQRFDPVTDFLITSHPERTTRRVPADSRRPSRRRRARAFWFGWMLAALACGPAYSQSDEPDETRPALRDVPGFRRGFGETTEDATKAKRPPASSRVGRIPRFRQVPSRGAGTTGFISTNVPRRRLPATGSAGVTLPKLAPMPGVVDPTWPPPDDLATPGAEGEQNPAATARSRAARTLQDGSGAAQTAGATASSPPIPGGSPPSPGPTFGAGSTPGTPVPSHTIAGANLPYSLRGKPAIDDDPFGAVGIRAGDFVLRPAVEVWSGYDSNPGRFINGRGSAFVIVSPELQVQSNWERNELTANIRGSYNDYLSVPFADRPTLDAKIDGRIDVTRDTRIYVEGRDIVGTDYPGSPNVQADFAKLPIFDTLGGTLGFGQRFNRLDLTFNTLIDRTVWGPSQLTNGTTESNDDRNFNQYAGTFRASYELSPTIKPFVAVEADTRVHDLRFDRDGLQRDSRGFEVNAGASVDLLRVLTGEASVGYLTRLYRDPNLPDIKTLAVDGSLAWRATALTTVKLTAKTTADESVLSGVSGVVDRNVELDVEHALRRWLIGIVRFAYGHDDYPGTGYVDQRYLAGIGLTYKLTRTTQIKGEVRQEWLQSNLPGLGYNATVAMVGVRYQP